MDNEVITIRDQIRLDCFFSSLLFLFTWSDLNPHDVCMYVSIKSIVKSLVVHVAGQRWCDVALCAVCAVLCRGTKGVVWTGWSWTANKGFKVYAFSLLLLCHWKKGRVWWGLLLSASATEYGVQESVQAMSTRCNNATFCLLADWYTMG